MHIYYNVCRCGCVITNEHNWFIVYYQALTGFFSVFFCFCFVLFCFLLGLNNGRLTEVSTPWRLTRIGTRPRPEQELTWLFLWTCSLHAERGCMRPRLRWWCGIGVLLRCDPNPYYDGKYILCVILWYTGNQMNRLWSLAHGRFWNNNNWISK